MFNQVLALFQGFFSRAFWFGNFLPVVIAAAPHFLVASVQFPDRVPFEKWMTASTVENVAYLSVSFVSLVVLAYAIAPLIPLFRGVFDGRLLWEWLANQLRRQRVIEARRIRDKIAAANDLFNEYDWFNRNHQEWFDRASNRGAVAGTATDESSTVKAERAVGELQKQAAQARLPPASLAHDAFEAVIAALASNSSELPPGHAQHDRSRRVATTREIFENLLGPLPMYRAT